MTRSCQTQWSSQLTTHPKKSNIHTSADSKTKVQAKPITEIDLKVMTILQCKHSECWACNYLIKSKVILTDRCRLANYLPRQNSIQQSWLDLICESITKRKAEKEGCGKSTRNSSVLNLIDSSNELLNVV